MSSVSAGFYVWSQINSSNNLRALASVPEHALFDLEGLIEGNGRRALVRSLIRRAGMLQVEDRQGIKLGQVIVRSGDQKPKVICQWFDQVEVVFLAEGVAYDGHQPEITARAKCEVSENFLELETVWIPIAELFSHKPADADYTVSGDFESEIKIRHVMDFWPESWVLNEIRFSSSSKSLTPLIISSREIYLEASKPLKLSAPAAATSF